jgi:hypothetical protein
MINIWHIATIAAILLGAASMAMANDLGMRANTVGSSVAQYVAFCAQPPQFGGSHAQPHGPYSLPPSATIRNPDVSAFAWEEKRFFDRVSRDICIPA